MYSYIKKALYIKITADKKLFNKAFKGNLNEINVPLDKEWTEIIERENEFLRVVCGGAYVDFVIKKVFIDRDYVIRLGDIIDSNKQKTHEYININTDETCIASTIQEASSFLGVNVRHVKKVKPEKL